jgi:hypothetical protein
MNRIKLILQSLFAGTVFIVTWVSTTGVVMVAQRHL